MHTVTSKDGSTIAYDRTGSGPVVVLVAPALADRSSPEMRELARLLSDRCTVINYDRRGRGDSTDNGAATDADLLQREIEDISALIEAEGGSAAIWGWSSGGALAVRAAAAGIGVNRVSVYEVPFMVDPGHNYPTPDYAERQDELVAAGDRAGAVKHFMRNAIGVPSFVVWTMRVMPMWKGLLANAHTLGYDWAALGKHTMYGAALDPAEFAPVSMPAQVVYGSKSPSPLRQGSRALAEVLPSAELVVQEGVGHAVKPAKLAPVLAGFVTGSVPGAPA
ncbi:MAG: alpha/beta fold hydrolase [Micromonosporaceae bacterium]